MLLIKCFHLPLQVKEFLKELCLEVNKKLPKKPPPPKKYPPEYQLFVLSLKHFSNTVVHTVCSTKNAMPTANMFLRLH